MSWFESPAVAAFIGAIGATLASLITLLASQRHARALAREERDHAERQAEQNRIFQARESRYADRLNAVIEFNAAAEDETNRIAEFEREHHHGLAPADAYEDYLFSRLDLAHAHLAVLVPPSVSSAAETLRAAVNSCFLGSDAHWTKYREALAATQGAARAMRAEQNPNLAAGAERTT